MCPNIKNGLKNNASSSTDNKLYFCFGTEVHLLLGIMAFDKDQSGDNALLKHLV
jgi:hypothetical protein